MCLKVISGFIIALAVTSALPAPTGDYDFIFGSSTQTAQGSSKYRNDYLYDSELNTYFKEHTLPATWFEAVATCRTEGSDLAVPETEAKLMKIKDLLSDDTEGIWFGIHDLYSEGYFVTLNGKPASEIYLNWGENQPSDDDSKERNCVFFSMNGTYSDTRCADRNRFVCSTNKEFSWSDKCRWYDRGYVYNKTTKNCYKFHTKPMTWNDANKICELEQAHLAEINNENEAFVFVEKLEEYPEDKLKGSFSKGFVHVDFSDLIKSGVFKTVSGKTLKEAGYYDWDTNEPDNVDEKTDRCGAMNRNGKLNNVNCNQKAMFFCEKTIRN